MSPCHYRATRRDAIGAIGACTGVSKKAPDVTLRPDDDSFPPDSSGARRSDSAPTSRVTQPGLGSVWLSGLLHPQVIEAGGCRLTVSCKHLSTSSFLMLVEVRTAGGDDVAVADEKYSECSSPLSAVSTVFRHVRPQPRHVRSCDRLMVQ